MAVTPEGPQCSGQAKEDPMVRGSIVLGPNTPMGLGNMKPEPSPLLFMEPEFKVSLNFTVRLGADYAFARNMRIGEMVDLIETDKTAPMQRGKYIGKAIIYQVIVCPFDQLPDTVINNEHDGGCRNRDSLRRTMADVYPEVSDWKNQYVTAIGFYVINK